MPSYEMLLEESGYALFLLWRGRGRRLLSMYTCHLGLRVGGGGSHAKFGNLEVRDSVERVSCSVSLLSGARTIGKVAGYY